MPISKPSLSAALVALALLLTPSPAATAGPEILIPGAPLVRQLSGGETHLYEVSLTPGDLLRVAAGQEELDLRLTVRLPFATLLATAVFDGPVLAGIGRRPSRDTIVEEMAALIFYGSSGRTNMKAPDR